MVVKCDDLQRRRRFLLGRHLAQCVKSTSANVAVLCPLRCCNRAGVENAERDTMLPKLHAVYVVERAAPRTASQLLEKRPVVPLVLHRRLISNGELGDVDRSAFGKTPDVG